MPTEYFKTHPFYNQEFIDELIHYGEYITDFSKGRMQEDYRIQVIKHDRSGDLYWLVRHNGYVEECKKLN